MPQRNLVFGLVLIFFVFGITEGLLRLQQTLGPAYDLEFLNFAQDNFLSETLNHNPTANLGYNKDGIQAFRNVTAPPGAFKILFLGDSFMQGDPPEDTLPEFVRAEFLKAGLNENAFTLWNAGCSSYAPSIYAVQARQLIPKYQPDFVVVAIDESDLVDDYAIYGHLIERDAGGKIAAVRGSPPVRTKMAGYAAIRRQPLYLIRLFSMWYHKVRLYFVFKAYNQRYKSKYMQVPLAETSRRFSFNLAPGFDLAPDVESKYAGEAAFLKVSVAELAQTLSSLMGGPEKVLFLYHPHVYQLTPDPRGHVWRRWVPDILTAVNRQSGIAFYDVSEDLKKAFGNRPELSYHDEDMHFNRQGMENYGRLIAKKLLPKLKAP